MSVKKKQLLTATLIIALTAAVAVNWYYTNNSPVVSDDSLSQSISEENNLGDTLLVAGSTVNQEETEYVISDSVETLSTDSDTYFSEAKLKRTQSRDEVLEEIEEFLDDDSISQQDKSAVTQMLTDFKDSIKRETDTENLIKAKTGSECLVVINDGTGNVVVEKGVLNDSVIMQITDIFEKNTDILAENLTIIEAK